MSDNNNNTHVFEQKLNTLHVENLYLREVFNHKINELETRLTEKIDAKNQNVIVASPQNLLLENTTTQQLVEKKFTPMARKSHTYKRKTITDVAANTAFLRNPSAMTFETAFKMSKMQDKPIMTDYWQCPNAMIGIHENKTKLLVKSAEEYTSPIVKMYKPSRFHLL